MLVAFAWGLAAASTLLVGAALALSVTIAERTLGLVMAFGAGVLISAVSFELVEEAVAVAGGARTTGIGFLLGALVFTAGNALIERLGRRRGSGGGEGLPIVLGTVLDGLPESAVIGIGLLAGNGVGLGVLLAVAISNLPEGIAATSGLLAGGWRRGRIVLLWSVVALASGLAALAGYGLLGGASGATIALVDGFAGGAILAMLADSMMPEAYAHGHRLTGLATALGFGCAFLLSSAT